MQPSVIGSKQRVISGFIELDWQHVMMQEKEPAYGIKPAQIDKIVSPGSGRTKESINYGSSKCRVGASKQRESTRKMSRSELMRVSQVSETDPYQRMWRKASRPRYSCLLQLKTQSADQQPYYDLGHVRDA